MALVQPARAEDESQPCNPDGQVIAYGDVLASCTIELIGDLDVFQFAASAGDTITALLTWTGGGGGAPCVMLQDPTGNPIGSETCGFAIRLSPAPLPSSGTYQLVVTDAFNNQTLEFNLSLERLFPLRSPTPLGFGELVTGRQIMPLADLDTFSFIGQAGDQVRILVSWISGPGIQCLEVRAPDNTQVGDQMCDLSIDLSLSLTISGAYQLIVTDANNNQPLTYNIAVNCLSGSCANRPPSCFVDPSLGGSTLTLDFTLGSTEPTDWHVSLAALGTVFPLWTLPIPAVNPPVSTQLNIPGFPGLGSVGFLSTLTTAAGIICHDFKTVDTGPGPAMTRQSLENLLRRPRQDE